MKAIIFLLFFLMLMMTEMIFAQQPPLEPGVSQTLAKWRAAHYSDVRYKLNITLEKGAPLMRGTIEVSVKLTDEGAKNDLILDWRTTQFQNDKDKPFAEVVAVNDATGAQASSLANTAFFSGVKTSDNLERNDYQTPVSVRSERSLQAGTLALQSNEHLIIRKDLLKTGENIIKINFASPIKTSGSAITRYVDKEDGAEYIYSLFVPSDASTAFPVFDQPDLKARFQLTVGAPEDWDVISNTSPFTTDNIGVTIFPETKPISTYIFAFAAGNFDVFVDGYNDSYRQFQKKNPSNEEFSKFLNSKKSRIYVRQSQAEKFKQHAAEVFRLNREGVKFLETYFDYKFPFPKYDLVLIPEFPFGGMEHAGATFLRESSVIFPTEPTKNDLISRANVIFHEAAHQWFGDTVTMKWFDDLWLKEGFAEFMAYKTLEKVMPEYNAWKIFYERNKQAAYLTDSTKGTTPIYQEIPNLSAAKSAYGNIVYRKAPSFLKQAEFYLGEKEFQTAVRLFLKKHEYSNARWEDLVSDFARVKYDLPESGGTINVAQAQGLKEIIDWANGWIKQRGVPIIKLESNSISQKDALTENFKWIQKFKIYTFEKNPNPEYKDIVLIDSILLSKTNQPIKLSPQATFVFPNYQDYGYGIFLLDEKSRAYVLANIQAEKDDFLRAMMWGSLWDSVREAELAPQDYVELVIKNIAIETDESTIQTLLSRVAAAMNYYLTAPQAAAFVPRLEAVLVDKIANAQTAGQRITFYRAYLNLASSATAAKNLKDILTGRSKIAVFQLKTKDKFDIVTRLLILGDKDAPTLLANLEKTETSDDAKRYAYAAQAGIGSADAKAKYFKDFLTDKTVSESWIEAAFVPFNSVRHSDLTDIYLETALAELPNLKRSRKIFFVNGWLGAFIGGQRSEESLATVNKFLADNPNLDKDLRLKILENADGLERAVKIRAKYGK